MSRYHSRSHWIRLHEKGCIDHFEASISGSQIHKQALGQEMVADFPLAVAKLMVQESAKLTGLQLVPSSAIH